MWQRNEKVHQVPGLDRLSGIVSLYPLFEAFLNKNTFLEISCRERVNASVTRGGSVRIGEGVRATQAHIGRTGALVFFCGNVLDF